jgi:diguanylate cyclase (GGDEF)-like protein
LVEDHDVAFWSRYARNANLLNLFIVVIDTAYVVATWHSGRHRPALLVLNLVALVGVATSLFTSPEARFAASRHRDLVFAGWCAGGSLVVAYAVWADGGLRSPLAWLLPLSVMFTAMVHRPRLVVQSGAVAVVAYLLIGATDGTRSGHPTELFVQAAYLVALTFAATSAARYRWDHYDAQVLLRDRLSALADHDGLTGLLNHRAFHEHLAAELADAEPERRSTSVLLVDLDLFKAVNDTHGHQTGDAVLRAVAVAITATVPGGSVVGRIGGEEFAVLLPSAGPELAGAAAERIRLAIEAVADPVPVTASVGVGTTAGACSTATHLLEQADGALYAAKRQGRNQVCWLRVA